MGLLTAAPFSLSQITGGAFLPCVAGYLTHPSPGSIELRPHSAIGNSLIHLPRQQAEVPNSALSPENWIVFG